MTHNKEITDPHLIQQMVGNLVTMARFNIGSAHSKKLEWDIYCHHDEDYPRLCLTIQFGHDADLSIWFREADRMNDFLDAVKSAYSDKPVDLNGHCSSVLVLSDEDDDDVFTLTMNASEMERLYHNLLDGYRVVFLGERPRLTESGAL